MRRNRRANTTISALAGLGATIITLLLVGYATLPNLSEKSTNPKAKCTPNENTDDLSRDVIGPRVIQTCSPEPVIWHEHIQIRCNATIYLKGHAPAEFEIFNSSIELNVTEHGRTTSYSAILMGPKEIVISFVTQKNPGSGHLVYEPTSAGTYVVFTETISMPEAGYYENFTFVVSAIPKTQANMAVKCLEITSLPIDADLLWSETADTFVNIDGPYRNATSIHAKINATAGKRVEVQFFRFENPLDVKVELRFEILAPLNPVLFMEYSWRLNYTAGINGSNSTRVIWINDGNIVSSSATYILTPGGCLEVTVILLMDLATDDNRAAVSILETWKLIHE